MFASIREAYGIERDDSLKLRDYPTLAHVVGFVHDRCGTADTADTTTPAEPETATTTPAEPETATAPPATQATNTPEPEPDGFPRRVPVPVLRPPLDSCVETALQLEGARVLVMPDSGGVAPELSKRLEAVGATVLTIEGAPDTGALEQQLKVWSDEGPIDGVFWLPGLDPEGEVAELDAATRQAALHVRVKLLAAAMRTLESGAFLLSGTRLGGRHGYDAAGATGVFGGAVTGFTKALSRERPDALVKSVDFELGGAPAQTAELILAEALRDPGAVEIGYADGLRWSVGLIDAPARPDASRRPDASTVFLITGAAGSIVSAITADLAAAAGGGVFHMLDLVPEPDPEDPDLARFSSDRDGLKAELAERIRERGKRPTPKLIERELARIERACAARDAIAEIERAGGEVHWHQLDLTDPEQVARALAAAVERSGKIDVLMHCAGLEISHFLADKPQREYDLVFDVKAHGWLNVLAGLEQAGAKPGAAVVFSSIAGRFGNGGQTDYSAANDLLCKSVSQMRRGGTTRGIAIDWTAWSEIGMASRGSIPTVMKAARIDMLAPEEGIPIVRRELTAAGSGGETLVAGSLGILLAERHPSGGVDLDRVSSALLQSGGPMSGRVDSFTADGTLTVLTELDPARQAFLNDHRMDGTPVLPGVMGMEGFAETAKALVPGYEVIELEDVELLAPFKFYRDEPRTAILRARLRDGGGGTVLADCELLGRRRLPGQDEVETRHFSGRARLAASVPAQPQGAVVPDDGQGVDHDALYGVYFHGPAYQVLDRAWRDNGNVVGRLASQLPADHDPESRPTELAPRLIELCFQTAGVWELGTAGRIALPTHVDRVFRYAGASDPGRLTAVVSPHAGGADAEVVDEHGKVRVRLEGYRTIELPGAVQDEALAPIRDAMAGGD